MMPENLIKHSKQIRIKRRLVKCGMADYFPGGYILRPYIVNPGIGIEMRKIRRSAPLPNKNQADNQRQQKKGKIKIITV